MAEENWLDSLILAGCLSVGLVIWLPLLHFFVAAQFFPPSPTLAANLSNDQGGSCVSFLDLSKCKATDWMTYRWSGEGNTASFFDRAFSEGFEASGVNGSVEDLLALVKSSAEPEWVCADYSVALGRLLKAEGIAFYYAVTGIGNESHGSGHAFLLVNTSRGWVPVEAQNKDPFTASKRLWLNTPEAIDYYSDLLLFNAYADYSRAGNKVEVKGKLAGIRCDLTDEELYDSSCFDEWLDGLANGSGGSGGVGVYKVEAVMNVTVEWRNESVR